MSEAESKPAKVAKEKLLGDKPRLPTRIAAQVAWSSIKVRLSRSLVTVSSVVLAVAFLLVVVGGDISDHAVYGSYATDDRPTADVRTIYEVLGEPREPLALLSLLAEDEGIAAWAADLGVELPPYEPAAARRALELADWVAGLKATDRFKALENRRLHTWLLRLDEEGAADRFLAMVDTFRGVRLAMEPQAILDLAGRIGSLRAAVEALRRAEAARLARVEASGGVESVIAAIRSGELARGEGDASGLPMAQALGEVDPDRHAALRAQLDLLALRDHARQLFDAVNKMIPTVSKVGLDEFRDGTVASRSEAFTIELGGLVDDLGALREQVLVAGELAPLRAALEASGELQAIADEKERADRIQRLVESPGTQAWLLQARLESDLAAEERALLRGELEERERLDALAETFKQGGFDPSGESNRTFWLLVLSLLVCIVGIVNSMMMAVTERFREIATMKCLGAMDGFILKAFLIESGSVGLVGSVAGALLGVAVVLLQSSVTYGGTFWGAFPVGDLALAALAALGTGILLTVFGALLPAYRAARMHPIEAMRLET